MSLRVEVHSADGVQTVLRLNERTYADKRVRVIHRNRILSAYLLHRVGVIRCFERGVGGGRVPGNSRGCYKNNGFIGVFCEKRRTQRIHSAVKTRFVRVAGITERRTEHPVYHTAHDRNDIGGVGQVLCLHTQRARVAC